MNPFIIAEAGVNHNGDLGLAFELAKQAKACGADAVKYQTYKAEKLAGAQTPKVPYQLESAPSEEESHLEMLKKLELSFEATEKVKTYCDEIGIEFMSTPYDPESVEFLHQIQVQRMKVASADLGDFQIQRAIRKTGLPVIQSVGMATWEEIDHWNQSYENEIKGYPRILLQCTSNYPSDPFNANLKTMAVMRDAFGVDVGFSDHTPDDRAAILSVAMGAVVIEKHFTLDKTMEGPDHKASVDPKELRDYIQHIRDSVKILGVKSKKVADEEMNMRHISRKGVFAARPLKAGEVLGEADFVFRRPGQWMSMFEYDRLEKKELQRDVEEGEALKGEYFKS